MTERKLDFSTVEIREQKWGNSPAMEILANGVSVGTYHRLVGRGAVEAHCKDADMQAELERWNALRLAKEDEMTAKAAEQMWEDVANGPPVEPDPVPAPAPEPERLTAWGRFMQWPWRPL